MDTLTTSLNMVKKCSFIENIDPSNACCSLAVALEDQKYLSFSLADQFKNTFVSLMTCNLLSEFLKNLETSVFRIA